MPQRGPRRSGELVGRFFRNPLIRLAESSFFILNKAFQFFGLRLIKVDNIPKSIPEILSSDFVRVYTMALFAASVRERGLDGDVAELGVYRGDFARHINRCFPDRTIWLFDTFDGFVSSDVISDRREGYSGETDANDTLWRDTSVEHVLARLPFPEKAKMRKGAFPQSAAGVDVAFCFASIDADLYEPIREGLRFFWPRLVHGGLIIVHDYNNIRYRGARVAVDEFCEAMSILSICIPDFGGSAILVKNDRQPAVTLSRGIP